MKKLFVILVVVFLTIGGAASASRCQKLVGRIDRPIDEVAPTIGVEAKVTLCHRTNSVANPYVRITVDKSAVDGGGQSDHSHHTGQVATSEAVAQALKDDGEKWGDIIPDVLNWDEDGQAVYNNDCKHVVPAAPEPTPEPVTTPAVIIIAEEPVAEYTAAPIAQEQQGK